ncbi:MAG: DUF1684 domain-containing protein [Thermoflexales bacterium]|nr:DUF1684 domain-containing protein [Thermoflexales bacterium]MBP8241739.1 DUF1684 domain-containing protein [Thermoflexales bacterium]
MNSYDIELNAFRDRLETSLRADDGWLALAGLFWLREGTNSVGGDPDSDIALPETSAPPRVGEIDFRAGRAILKVADGISVSVEGSPVSSAILVDDGDHRKPSLVQVGTVSFFVIRRGDRTGIRVRDTQSPARAAFTGRKWYAPDPAYRVSGRFVPHAEPRQLPNVNIVGITEMIDNPGRVSFDLGGRHHEVEAFDGGKDRLFLVIRDATSGKSTYGSSRFLNAPLRPDGHVELDFNRAYNPPCAFTPYATCPLPPAENILPVPIEAGELY